MKTEALQVVRFGLVAVAGLTVDLAIAWMIASYTAVPLPVAAACGFAAGAVLNYVLHQRWTFAVSGAGARRIIAYGLTLCATLLTRVMAVAAMAPLADRALAGEPAVLLLATGASFLVNFLMSKHLVFAPRPSEPEIDSQ